LGKIHLKNIRIYSYHGCLVEESKIGSDYRVDLTITTDLSKSAQSDKLADTVDYVLLNQIVKDEMAIRSELLEHVAQRIVNSVFAKSSTITKVKVRVAKLNPPIGGDVESVAVVLKQKRK